MKAQCCGRMIGLGLLGLVGINTELRAITTEIYGSLDAYIDGRTSTYKYFRNETNTSQSNGFVYFFNGPDPNPLHVDGNVYSAGDKGGAHISTRINASRPMPVNPTGTGTMNYSASGQVTVTFTDLVVTGPGSGPITTSFATKLDGVQHVNVSQYTNSTPGTVQSQSLVSVSLMGNGLDPTQSFHHETLRAGSAQESGGYGGLESFDGSAILNSNAFTVIPNVEFSVTMILSTSNTAALLDGGAGVAEADSNFENTLSFVTDRDVFALPAGYTVNSVSAGIVNNRYTGAGDPPVIPEPTSLVLLGLAAPLAVRRMRTLR